MEYKLYQYSCKQLEQTPEQWRMNLIAYNQDTNDLFCALKNRIYRYNTSQFEIQDPQTMYYGEVDSFNQIKIYDNNLFAISENSIVIIINILTGQTQKLTAKYIDSNDNSLWSIDISKKLLAIGSNSTKISIWNVQKIFQSNNSDETYKLFTGTKYMQNDETLQRYFIPAAKHNIPCIKFTPCEKYLGCGSIDQKFRIFNVHTYKKIYIIELEQYIWSIEYRQQFQTGKITDYQIFVGLKSIIQLLQVQNKILVKLCVINQPTGFYFNNVSRFSMIQYLKEINSLIVVPYYGSIYQIYTFWNNDQHQYSKIEAPEKQFIASSQILSIGNKIISFRMTNKLISMDEIKYNEINQQIL